MKSETIGYIHSILNWLFRKAGRVIVLCSCARHFSLTVPLSTQEYQWVPADCQGNLTKCWEVTCNGLASHPGGVAILLVASCYRNRDNLRQCGPLGLCARLFLLIKVLQTGRVYEFSDFCFSNQSTTLKELCHGLCVLKKLA